MSSSIHVRPARKSSSIHVRLVREMSSSIHVRLVRDMSLSIHVHQVGMVSFVKIVQGSGKLGDVYPAVVVSSLPSSEH